MAITFSTDVRLSIMTPIRKALLEPYELECFYYHDKFQSVIQLFDTSMGA